MPYENAKDKKEPPKKPTGIQEGYDPFNEASTPPTTPQPLPSNSPLDATAGGGSDVIPSPLNGMESAGGKQPSHMQPKSPVTNAQIGAPGLAKNNAKTQPLSPPPVVSPDGEDNEKAVPIQLEDGLEEQDYFHGLLPREDIEALLQRDGDFVLRVTELRDNVKKATRELCLSVYWNNNVHHYLLRPNTFKRYQICNPLPGERLPEFENVNKMINHYLDGKVVFSNHQVILKTPICRQEWELRHKEIICKIKLGSGAFGDVFSGVLKRKDQKSVKVAIKMLKGDKVDKKKILEIMGEARVMRPLKHKHVVRCFGVAADMEPLMIVMELINGGALDVYLRCNTNKVSMDRRVNMTLDAALGLEFVHSKNILHRDIAARNCLYDAKVLKVSDFGLSVVGEKHILGANEKAPVRWLAPEVFRTHTYSRPSDVWAYGVLVWEIFNDAEEPYKGWTGSQIRDSVLNVGNKLQMPDWAGPHLAKLVTDVFEIDPNVRITMSDVVKRMEKIAPKREHAEDEEESQENSGKGNINNKGKGSKSRKAFKFFDKPKELPKSDKEQPSDVERSGGKGAISKIGRISNSAFGKPFKKQGSKEKHAKKGLSKETFSRLGKTNSNDFTLSKESKKKKKVKASVKELHRRKTMEQPEKDDNSSRKTLKQSDEDHKQRRASSNETEKEFKKGKVGESRIKVPHESRVKVGNHSKGSKQKKKGKPDGSSSEENDSVKPHKGGSLEGLSKSKLQQQMAMKPGSKDNN